MSVLELTENPEVQDVPIYDTFTSWTKDQLEEFRVKMGLAMSLEDLAFIQDYFKNEEKESRPTLKSDCWTPIGVTTVVTPLLRQSSPTSCSRHPSCNINYKKLTISTLK